MSHNFRDLGFTPAINVSKAGHDSNPGTPAEPRRTIVSNSQVGAGVYAQSGAAVTGNCRGDGKVLWNLLNTALGSTAIYDFRNLTLINGAGFNDATAGTPGQRLVIDCDLIDFTALVVGAATARDVRFLRCKLINSTGALTGIGIANYQFNDGIVINSLIFGAVGAKAVGFFNNNYVDFSSVIQFLGTAANWRNNNVQGIIRMPVTGGLFADFAIQDQFVGTPQANGYPIGVQWLTEANLTAAGYTGTVTGWNAAVATCINRDPRFNDAAGRDFTLQADSPHIRRAQNGIDNIGGTRVARSVINTDHNGVTIFVLPSPQIDTSIPNSYRLAAGQTEGFIDYICDLGSVIALDVLDGKFELFFDSDFAGGSAQNRNVPDSEPLTTEYALRVNTAAAAGAQNQLIVPTGLIPVGQFVRVAGEVRQVTARTPGTPNDTITVASNFRATVGAGVTITYGTQSQLGAINPNRLTFQLRTSKQATRPLVDADWDNDLDPALLCAGVFFTQEWGLRPILAIQSGLVWGGGDSDRPIGATIREIQARWLGVRPYVRDNYSSNGL